MNFTDLGRISYDDALELMMQAHQKCTQTTGDNQLFLLEHEAVITKGRRLHGLDIPFQDQILQNNIQIREADRGGLLTYHGPGQLVVYFVIRLNDYFSGISEMVHELESIIKEFLKFYDLQGRTDEAHPGIWVGDKKIASIGLRVAGGVTRHGISINLNNSLKAYDFFDPCGLTGSTMSTVAKVANLEFDESELQKSKINLQKIISNKLILRSISQ